MARHGLQPWKPLTLEKLRGVANNTPCPTYEDALTVAYSNTHILAPRIISPHNNIHGGNMKYITLVASEIVDGQKVELGRQEHFPVAETLADIEDMGNQDNGWNDDEIVACFNSGAKVKRQAQLRQGSDPKSPMAIFKKAGHDKQNKLLELAKEQGLL